MSSPNATDHNCHSKILNDGNRPGEAHVVHVTVELHLAA